jgi:site-specific DNA-methyltransferase (adenine-specific)
MLELNKIYHGNCIELINDVEYVDCIITSPPYNVGIHYDNYNDNLTRDEYEKFILNVFSKCIDKLSEGGHLIINIANTGRNPYYHLSGAISYMLRDLIRQVGEIIWIKLPTNSTAWGSWCSAQSPCIRDEHEYILVFRKNGKRKDGNSDISKQEFMDYTKSIWKIQPDSERSLGHPATFPISLVSKIIKLFTFKDEIILDPFSGTGTTCYSAKSLGRKYIGFDISKKYCEQAERRLSQEFLI